MFGHDLPNNNKSSHDREPQSGQAWTRRAGVESGERGAGTHTLHGLWEGGDEPGVRLARKGEDEGNVVERASKGVAVEDGQRRSSEGRGKRESRLAEGASDGWLAL